MPLHLRVIPSSPTPIYRQIVDQVRAAIARGELSAGDALPSVRALAEELVVNANTIAKAISELVRHGDVVSMHGRGVFVASRPPEMPNVERKRRLTVAIERLVAEAIHLGVTRELLLTSIEEHCDRLGVLRTRKERKHG